MVGRMLDGVCGANATRVDGGAGFGAGVALPRALAAIPIFCSGVQLGDYGGVEGCHAAEDVGKDGHQGAEIGLC